MLPSPHMTPAQLKAARKKLKARQPDIAAALGVSRNTYQRMEYGQHPISEPVAVYVRAYLLPKHGH
ncbi:helix-turn-helix domain-containing protein [Ferrimonas balearica]|uniref:helix-turn-helix domain-containing protein n=1 Tax=Ferrimonas balearica TaxID=44012 RepID=UPI001C94D874|nr:helix-turn-helix transcriptional regulator [Ferrimonas balearica]MBY6104991.1 helix-turn-helix domain-containing protein [Ferrimonas balearica]